MDSIRGYCKMNLYYPLIVEYIMCEQNIIHENEIPLSMKFLSDSPN